LRASENSVMALSYRAVDLSATFVMATAD